MRCVLSQRRRRRGERGVTALLTALLAVTLLGALAFVSDFGFAYANQRRIQTGADAAALAVGRKIAVSAGPSDTCSTVSSSFGTSAERSYAAGVFAKNAASGAGLEPGATGFDVSCTPAGVVVVTVKGAQDSPTFFGGIFGQSRVRVGERAQVTVGALGAVVGVRPFAICKTIADSVRNNPGTTFVVPITNTNTGCGSAAGNWSMLDFNGGSNPTGDMQNWIANGYPEPLSVTSPTQIPGDPGFNVNAAQSEMDSMMALDNVVFPVFSTVTGNGNNASFTVIGFVSVTPCRYQINNKSGPGSASVNPGCGAAPTTNGSWIQLKYSAFIPIGQLNLTCRLGDHSCDAGPRGTSLAD